MPVFVSVTKRLNCGEKESVSKDDIKNKRVDLLRNTEEESGIKMLAP